MMGGMANAGDTADLAIPIRRLGRADASQIVDCFARSYGTSYANELFYDAAQLARRMEEERLFSVGAIDANERLIAHMALSVPRLRSASAEAGNSVVDPPFRGGGVAWRVGDELTRWCEELGFRGFLHYPTTAHHIMQRQSVADGFETGLMLGYIPGETDGKHGVSGLLRRAATIVYRPIRPLPLQSLYVPEQFRALLTELAGATGIPREWNADSPVAPQRAAEVDRTHMARRNLVRIEIVRSGRDLMPRLEATLGRFPDAPCVQVDVWMDDPGIQLVADELAQLGFRFCGWLPGLGHTDLLRLQRVNPRTTDLAPALVNPVAQQLLAMVV